MTTEKTRCCLQVRKGPDSIVFNENTFTSGIAELTLTLSINRSVGGAVEASSLHMHSIVVRLEFGLLSVIILTNVKVNIIIIILIILKVNINMDPLALTPTNQDCLMLNCYSAIVQIDKA